MQITTDTLLATPCDDEEGDMATVCCLGSEMFALTRDPKDTCAVLTLGDEDGFEISDFKVTLGKARLLIELAAADAIKGDDQVQINFKGEHVDFAEVEQTLKAILKGTGTYVSEL
ncbi:hypothetical protein [Pseudomonas sp. R5(2019)]|uniref:hypothetical protein n=1 Tax=Pseudomonas sp. R5(2019) TaxID=2697566 RepID=UPI00141257D0|nr:hypothetical protein [Pseudomonas sp. R5(2019)]NBA96877.1 hypothetical protein [Pseudomonas sp. R5(2019)]